MRVDAVPLRGDEPLALLLALRDDDALLLRDDDALLLRGDEPLALLLALRVDEPLLRDVLREVPLPLLRRDDELRDEDLRRVPLLRGTTSCGTRTPSRACAPWPAPPP